MPQFQSNTTEFILVFLLSVFSVCNSFESEKSAYHYLKCIYLFAYSLSRVLSYKSVFDQKLSKNHPFT